MFCLAGAIWLSAPFLSAQTPLDNEATVENKQAELATLQTFAEVFSYVRDYYVEDVTDEELIEGALNGALSSLDPHSSYTPKQEFQEQQKTSRREYGGLGIEVTMEDGLVKVNYATPDAPADQAGIIAGDFITAVDGEEVLGKTLNDAVKGMRGPAGEPITVTVLSEGQKPRDVEIIRQVVLGRAVRHRVEEGLAYLFIESFNHPKLEKDFLVALEALKDEMKDDIPGIIVDLRGNRGGLLTQSINISSVFLDGGEVLSARGRTPEDTQRYHAEPGEVLPGVPLVVLINSGSASAAEIVAGAIQDRGRGLIVGRRSFGKGSVQSVIPLHRNGGGALRLTTQRYYTPSGRSIQGQGIVPDVSVDFRPDTGDARERFREDSYPNALTNASKDVSYKENPDDIIYPPEDWPETEDYQLSQAVALLKSPRYGSLLSAQNSHKLKP